MNYLRDDVIGQYNNSVEELKDALRKRLSRIVITDKRIGERYKAIIVGYDTYDVQIPVYHHYAELEDDRYNLDEEGYDKLAQKIKEVLVLGG